MNSEADMCGSILDNYEEGVYVIPVRKYWWQFWLPEYVEVGTYVTTGKLTTLYFQARVWTYLDKSSKS